MQIQCRTQFFTLDTAIRQPHTATVRHFIGVISLIEISVERILFYTNFLRFRMSAAMYDQLKNR